MITKEQNLNKYCLFYVSDFHLEMILLPYIKDNLQKSKITIITEEDLSTSIKILMDKVNLEDTQKEEILNLDWSNNFFKIEESNFDKNIIILNGKVKFIKEKNDEIKRMNLKNVDVIDCYNINKFNVDISEIKKEYDGVLNTKNI